MAIDYLRKAIDIQKEIYGEDHPTTAYTQAELGTLYYNNQEYLNAKQIYSKAYKTFKIKLARDHPHTKKIKKYLKKSEKNL